MIRGIGNWTQSGWMQPKRLQQPRLPQFGQAVSREQGEERNPFVMAPAVLAECGLKYSPHLKESFQSFLRLWESVEAVTPKPIETLIEPERDRFSPPRRTDLGDILYQPERFSKTYLKEALLCRRLGVKPEDLPGLVKRVFGFEFNPAKGLISTLANLLYVQEVEGLDIISEITLSQNKRGLTPKYREELIQKLQLSEHDPQALPTAKVKVEDLAKKLHISKNEALEEIRRVTGLPVYGGEEGRIAAYHAEKVIREYSSPGPDNVIFLPSRPGQWVTKTATFEIDGAQHSFKVTVPRDAITTSPNTTPRQPLEPADDAEEDWWNEGETTNEDHLTLRLGETLARSWQRFAQVRDSVAQNVQGYVAQKLQGKPVPPTVSRPILMAPALAPCLAQWKADRLISRSEEDHLVLPSPGINNVELETGRVLRMVAKVWLAENKINREDAEALQRGNLGDVIHVLNRVIEYRQPGLTPTDPMDQKLSYHLQWALLKKPPNPPLELVTKKAMQDALEPCQFRWREQGHITRIDRGQLAIATFSDDKSLNRSDVERLLDYIIKGWRGEHKISEEDARQLKNGTPDERILMLDRLLQEPTRMEPDDRNLVEHLEWAITGKRPGASAAPTVESPSAPQEEPDVVPAERRPTLFILPKEQAASRSERRQAPPPEPEPEPAAETEAAQAVSAPESKSRRHSNQAPREIPTGRLAIGLRRLMNHPPLDPLRFQVLCDQTTIDTRFVLKLVLDKWVTERKITPGERAQVVDLADPVNGSLKDLMRMLNRMVRDEAEGRGMTREDYYGFLSPFRETLKETVKNS